MCDLKISKEELKHSMVMEKITTIDSIHGKIDTEGGKLASFVWTAIMNISSNSDDEKLIPRGR